MTVTQSSSVRLPPHSMEAEESVLGAMLLSEASVSDVLEKLRSDDFYKPAHRKIFEAVVALFARGEAIDSVTVSEELRRNAHLEEIGGKPYLFHLVSSVPAASNASYYARIVEETALLRRLIEATQQAAAMAYESGDDVDNIIDSVEALVFSVAEKRLGDNFSHIKDLLHEQLEAIEALQERGGNITGVPTGFLDLDNITNGLQGSNLIIVAARPSFGKTSLALNIAQQAATDYNTPIAIFSLEMSRTELVQRLVCSEALVDVSKLRRGNLSDQDWSRLATAVGRLADAPIYIDDTESVTVLEIRAKARRLKQKNGLGLIIIDYMQLMSGPRRSENRQQEISEVSRSLKILARELDVPVIAVSQLSRAVESRQDKRPMLADLRESGCLTADTQITRADNGQQITMGELLLTGERDIPVWTLDTDFKLVPRLMTHVFPSGTKDVFELRLRSGRSVRGSANHPFLSFDGWKALETLEVGERIACPRVLPEPAVTERWSDLRVALLGQLIGDGSYLVHGPMRYTTQSEENSGIVRLAAESEFGATVKRYKGVKGGTWHQLVISGNGNRWHPAGVNKWLRDLGIFGQRSHQKRIPRAAFQLPTDQIALLLRHLWATDGSIHTTTRRGGHSIYYATNSDGLATDVASLLLRLGIVARITKSRKATYRPGYQVHVSGARDQLRFLHSVGAFGPRKGPAEELEAALASVVPNPNVDTIPVGVWDRVRASMGAQGLTRRDFAEHVGLAYSAPIPKVGGPGRERLRRYAEWLDDEELKLLSESDVFWDEIAEIVPLGPQPVFDATVPGTANFLANGIIAHNSIEQDADIVMFIYRDEVYNPDSTDKGVAELIVAKHRNGPVGRIKLTFLQQYTKFANYMGT